MSLVDDCVKVLGKEAIILSKKETDAAFNMLVQRFPFTRWGRIDWSQVKHSMKVNSVSGILSLLIEQGRKTQDDVFILWDEAKLPAIKSKIYVILNHIEEVTLVSFDTWIFCPDDNYIVEFYHEGEITIGFSKKDK